MPKTFHISFAICNFLYFLIGGAAYLLTILLSAKSPFDPYMPSQIHLFPVIIILSPILNSYGFYKLKTLSFIGVSNILLLLMGLTLYFSSVGHIFAIPFIIYPTFAFGITYLFKVSQSENNVGIPPKQANNNGVKSD